MDNISPCQGCGKSLSDFLDACPTCGHRRTTSATQASRVGPPPIPRSKPRSAPAAETTRGPDETSVPSAGANPSRWRLEEFPRQPVQHVLVTDIHMSLGAMVTFLVKLAIAAIPAMAIFGIFAVLAIWVVGGMRL